MTEIGGGILEVKGGGGGSTCRLNLYDGGAEIAVYGGICRNFDFSHNRAENPLHYFVAEGFIVAAKKAEEDTRCMAVPSVTDPVDDITMRSGLVGAGRGVLPRISADNAT